MSQRIWNSARYFSSTFKNLHPLFLGLCIFSVLASFLIYACKKKQNNEEDLVYIKVILFFIVMFVLLFIFFVLFGGISLHHIIASHPRLDTLHLFYFTMILLSTISILYIIKNWNPMMVLTPVISVILLYVAVSPKYAFSDSNYTDSTPKQRYEIMSAIVEEAKRQDRENATGFIVHMPYNHYGHNMGTIFYYHNVVDHVIPIQTVSDTSFYIENITP